jgi:hypothetical protein
MSRIASGYLVVALVLAPPSVLFGQDLRALRERLDREAALSATHATALQESRAPMRTYAGATDTIAIAGGAITVLAQREVAAVARAAAAQADSILAGIAPLLSRIQGAIVHVGLDSTGWRARTDGRPRAVVRFSVPPHRDASHSEGEPEPESISRAIEGTVLNRVMERNRTPFFIWRRGNLPLRREDIAREPEWGSVRFEVLETRSLLGPRCYRGDISACSMLLGFTRVDNPIAAWYDSTARLEMVTEAQSSLVRQNREATESCLAGNDDACLRALRAARRTYELPPGGPLSRDALTWQAIQIGGEGAVTRLLSHPGTPDEALAAAARVPIDSVIRVWNQNMRRGALGSDSLTPAMTLVAIGWVIILLGLSTRITRWR